MYNRHVGILEKPVQVDDIDAVRQAKSLYEKCLIYYSDDTNRTKTNSAMSGTSFFKETEEEIANHLPTNEFCSELVKNTFTTVVVHKYILQKYPDINQFEEIRTEVAIFLEIISFVIVFI